MNDSTSENSIFCTSYVTHCLLIFLLDLAGCGSTRENDSLISISIIHFNKLKLSTWLLILERRLQVFCCCTKDSTANRKALGYQEAPHSMNQHFNHFNLLRHCPVIKASDGDTLLVYHDSNLNINTVRLVSQRTTTLFY